MMNEVKFFTDGACSGNPGRGSWGVVVTDYNLYKNEKSLPIAYHGGVTEDTTNNREELRAILYAFHLINEYKREDDFHNIKREYIINSDSAYCVNALNNWIYKWVNNGWTTSKGDEVKNIDLFEILFNYILKFPDVQINKVSGHNGVIENELADQLATRKVVESKYVGPGPHTFKFKKQEIQFVFDLNPPRFNS